MPPAKLATRPMAAIPLANAEVVLVDHGKGAGFGFAVDGWPVPNAMLLPAGEVDRYNLVIGGIFADTLTRDDAMRWAARTARWYQTMIGTANGHATNGNGAAKPVAPTARNRASGAATTPRGAATAPKPAPAAKATISAAKNTTPLPRARARPARK